MITDLLAWFTGKEVNRRRFPRKRKPYRATYSLDGNAQKPAIGLDISGGGMCILTQEKIARDEFEVRATLYDRTARMRAKFVWTDPVTHQGRTCFRYGTRFTGIPADDWDAIIRFTTDRTTAEPNNKAQEELVSVRLSPDDTRRTATLGSAGCEGYAARSVLLLRRGASRKQDGAPADDPVEDRWG